MPETDKLLALSTAHVSYATMQLIEREVAGAVAYPNEYGAFIYTPEGLAEREVPEDLKVVLHFARQHNITWLKLDRDAPEIEDLPVFNWEEDDDSYPPRCSDPGGHDWQVSDENENICYCANCGADGNA